MMHLSHAQKRPLGESPVYFPHQRQIEGRFTGFFIGEAGTGDFEQKTLPDDTELHMAGVNHVLPAGCAHRFPQALAEKSRSTVSWPILACNSCSSFFFGLFRLDLAGKNARGRFLDLLHLLMDESLVHAELAAQLGYGLLPRKSGKGHSSLERGRMISALGH